MANKPFKGIKSSLLTDDYLNDPVSVAGLFDASTAYSKGAYVYHGLKLYCFTADHAAGAWTGSDVVEVTVGSELCTLKQDVTQAQADLENKANIDGSYDTMTVGNAKQLVSTVLVEDKAPYLFRTSGGSADIGDREYDEIVGGTVAWNQLAGLNDNEWDSKGGASLSHSDNNLIITATRDSSFKYCAKNIKKDHKYLFTGTIIAPVVENNEEYNAIYGVYYGSNSNEWMVIVVHNTTAVVSKIFNVSGTERRFMLSLTTGSVTGTSFTVEKPQLFDLTQMFGSTIADYVYGLESATAGSGVAWLNKNGFFTKEYYEYSAPTFKHVQNLVSHDMVGFNAYDHSSGKAKVVGGQQYQITGTYTAIALDGTTITPETGGYFTPDHSGELTVTGGNATATCVHLVWDGERDGEYEEYVKHSYPLDDSLILKGIPRLDANNNLYYLGDTYNSDGDVEHRVMGLVLNGDESWRIEQSANSKKYFFTELGNFGSITGVALMYNGYVRATQIMTRTSGLGYYTVYNSSGYNKALLAFRPGEEYGVLADLTVNDLKEALALNPIMVTYEVSVPTTESALAFQSPQIVDDFGTEEYVLASGAFPMPVGHVTQYQPNLRAKLEMSPDSPDGAGDYLVRQTNGQNEYVEYVSPVPSSPTEDGTYVLKATVSDGTATLTWVAEGGE